MEWPKRARTVNWESGVLTLDGEKQFELPELTPEIMEQLAGYTLVGFHVKGYPVTDELLAPFAGHKSMANFGVEDGALTDACFPVFSAMPKLRYLLLDGNAAIHGSGLSALRECKIDLLTLNRTGLDDAGLLQAASIPRLSHIQIDHTAVTYEGLLAIAGSSRIQPVAHVQFTKEAGGPCAIHQGADGTLLPAPAGKGQKARPAGRTGGGGVPQGAVRLLCRDDGMGAVYGAGRV